MLITLYNSSKEKKAVFGVNDSSSQVKEIHSDNVLSLSFTLYEHIELDVNDYVDFEGERYRMTEQYKPTQKSMQEWEYNVKLYGIESLIKRFLVLKTVDGENEPVFSLTAPARDHVALIVECINLGMGTTDWKVGEVVDTGNITIDYEGTYCHEGLKKVAEAAGTEWWFDGMTVNVCLCEHGGELTLGYGNGILSIERGTADNVKFYTRLFPVGSSRNIDPARYGYSRLQLPDGAKYVDVNTDKYGIIHHYEQDAFSHIYPKRTGTVSSVRSEEVTDEDGNPFTVYYFRDSGLDFDPNSYEIAGLVKQVTFQNGELNDREFEVNYDSGTKEFEIITVWPYDDGTQLPGGSLVPQAGDEYILWNIRMPDEYYPIAEAEYLAAVNEYNAAHGVDVSVYKCPTDHVWVEDNGAEFYLGRRIRLESAEYFPETGYRSSRITKMTRRVNLPSYVELEISDAVSKGGMENIEDSIDEVRNIVQTSISSIPDIVRSWENTPASDYNIYSSKRTLKEIADRALSRLKDDEALGLIKFLAGAEFGETIDSMLAGKGTLITPDGRVQTDRLEVRGSALFREIVYNRLSAQEGDTSYSENGLVESVTTESDGTYTLALQKRWENDFTAFKENDILYGDVNNLFASGEYYTSWVRVLSVNPTANTVSVVMYGDSEVPGGVNHAPEPLMRLVKRGNAVDTTRQSYWYLSATTEKCFVWLEGVDKPILDEDNYYVIIGRPKNLSIFSNLPLNYEHSYVYARGAIIQDLYRVKFDGAAVQQENPRGFWSLEVAQSDDPYKNDSSVFDTVSYYGCEWKCLVTGTLQEPKYAASDWAMLRGNPEFTIEIDSAKGWYFDVETFATTLFITGRLYNRDVTDSILDADCSWTRDTGDAAEDNAWAVKRADAGRSIDLTLDDLGPHYPTLTGCKFKCTALLRDGQQVEIAENYVTF